MDPNRFDALTRRTATASTRRDAIRAFAGGGLLAAIGLKAAPAAAQGTCSMEWTGNVRLGPDAGAMIVPGAAQPGEVKGTMSLTLGSDGAIEQGQLTLPDGTSMTVVGQATGRALNLRLTDGSGRVLVAVGTGEQPISACSGRIDGSLTGPQNGDIGEWHAVASGATGGTTGAPSGAATTNPAGQPPTNPAGSATNPGTAPGGNPPDSSGGSTSGCASGVVCNGVCCEGAPGLTPDSITCNGGFCECTYSCMSAGCGEGDGFIVNTCGSDPEPHCHSECNVPEGTGCGDMTCNEGETLDIDSCTCIPDGGGEGTDECVFADLMTDPNHCGFCGNVCPSGQCIEGNCTDPVN
jgi:hypothetical protein